MTITFCSIINLVLKYMLHKEGGLNYCYYEVYYFFDSFISRMYSFEKRILTDLRFRLLNSIRILYGMLEIDGYSLLF